MNIQVTITLNSDEYASNLTGNATEIAENVLTAAGGDPEKDTCQVSIQDVGTAGVAPTGPGPQRPPSVPPRPEPSD